MNWREILVNTPELFVKHFVALATEDEEIWWDFLANQSIDISEYRSLSGFIQSWKIEDYIRFVKAARIQSIWQLNKISSSLYEIGRRKNFFHNKKFVDETGITSRKRWNTIAYDVRWVDEYIKDNPTLKTVKSFDQGLRAQLKKIGLYEYFKKSLLSDRGSRGVRYNNDCLAFNQQPTDIEDNILCEKSDINLAELVEKKLDQLRTIIKKNRNLKIRQLRNRSSYKFLVKTSPHALYQTLIEMGFEKARKMLKRIEMNPSLGSQNAITKEWISRKLETLEHKIGSSKITNLASLQRTSVYQELNRYVPRVLLKRIQEFELLRANEDLNRDISIDDSEKISKAVLLTIVNNNIQKFDELPAENRKELYRLNLETRVKAAIFLLNLQNHSELLPFKIDFIKDGLNFLRVITYEYLSSNHPRIEKGLRMKGCLQNVGLVYATKTC